MNCEQYSSELWEHASGETAGELKDKIEAHLATCGPCSVELSKVKELIGALASPAKKDVHTAKERVFYGVFTNAFFDAVPILRGRFTLSKWASRVAVAITLIIALFMAVWPSHSSAISVDDLLDLHLKRSEYEKGSFAIATELDMDRKILEILGLHPHPVDISHHKFVGGEFLKINSVTASHALFELESGELISHFHIYDYYGSIKNHSQVVWVKSNLYHISLENHNIVIRKDVEDGHYEVYVGEGPVEKLLKFVNLKNSLPPGR